MMRGLTNGVMVQDAQWLSHFSQGVRYRHGKIEGMGRFVRRLFQDASGRIATACRTRMSDGPPDPQQKNQQIDVLLCHAFPSFPRPPLRSGRARRVMETNCTEDFFKKIKIMDNVTNDAIRFRVGFSVCLSAC